MEKKYTDREVDQQIVPAITDYVRKRRQRFKAVEILIEIVGRANDEFLPSKKEKRVFRNQFILNYLNQSKQTRVSFVTHSICKLALEDNAQRVERCFKDVFKMRILKGQQPNSEEHERSTKFCKNQLVLIDKMRSGQYYFEKQLQ